MNQQGKGGGDLDARGTKGSTSAIPAPAGSLNAIGKQR